MAARQVPGLVTIVTRFSAYSPRRVAQVQAEKVHSLDQKWWFDGAVWRPAFSEDGAHWFDGVSWQLRDRGPGSQRRGQRTLVVVLVAVGVLAGVAVLAVNVAGFYLYATHDRLELLDLPEVSDAADAGCRGVVDALSAPTEDRAERIDQGNDAIDRLIVRVMAVGDGNLEDDLPARQWLEDWRALAAARDHSEDELRLGRPAAFAVPMTDDGYPITGRMAWAGPQSCEQAVDLASTP